jgi:hypothetical protein
VIPPFDHTGNLPQGEHPCTWDEFENRYSTTAHRINLLNGLYEALENLSQAGCQTVWIDGSFISDKPNPNDFDACWDSSHVDPDLLEPTLLDFRHPRSAMKRKYKGELFIADLPATPHGETFLDFFQKDRNNNPKGILRLDLGSLPIPRT